MELLRVVDKLGNDTNEIIEREELHNRGKLHNEVTIYIINDKGEVLLQRRSKNRRFCPNKLGVIAGHQSYREDILSLNFVFFIYYLLFLCMTFLNHSSLI